MNRKCFQKDERQKHAAKQANWAKQGKQANLSEIPRYEKTLAIS